MEAIWVIEEMGGQQSFSEEDIVLDHHAAKFPRRRESNENTMSQYLNTSYSSSSPGAKAPVLSAR